MSLIYKLAIKEKLNLSELYNIFQQLIFFNNNNTISKIAVAVSGGSDSLALAILLNLWCKQNNIKLIALIVDHNLRVESKSEAEQVKKWLKNHNIDSEILIRKNIKLTSKIQETARKDRYNLLLEYCKKNNIIHLAIGQHFNDLVETIIMRKHRGNNIWGDTGISMKIVKRETILIRPLLYYTKLAIQNTLKDYQATWIEDPSNHNKIFERTKIRNEVIITKHNIKYYCDDINKAITNRVILEQQLIDFLLKQVEISSLGVIKLNLDNFKSLVNDKLKISIIGCLIKFITANDYMPKINKLQHLISIIMSNSFKKVTLGNCILAKKDNILLLIKENRNIKDQQIINSQNYLFWDQRFIIKVNDLANGSIIKTLTSAEYDKLIFAYPKIKQELMILQLNKDIILSLPWLFNNKLEVCNDWYKNITNHNLVYFKPEKSIINDIFYSIKHC
ncbi:tRNA lysidine(34) synthetase TilS [Rickettsiales bacterium LUAb2]